VERGSPGGAAVVGVVLCILVGVGGNVGPYSANENCLAFERVGGEDFGAAVFEFTDEGWAKVGGFAVDELLAPLVRLRVVEKETQTFPMAFGAVGFDLFKLRAATPDGAHGNGAIEIDGLL